MTHHKFDNKANYQEKMNPKEESTVDYFAMVMKKKKEERIYAVIVFILTVISIIGTYLGVHSIFKLGTTLAYIMLGIIAIPILLMIGGLLLLSFNKDIYTPKRDRMLTFTSVNYLLFVFIGNCIGVFFLIKMGTIGAYFISAMIICVVLYVAIKAVKSRMGEKSFNA